VFGKYHAVQTKYCDEIIPENENAAEHIELVKKYSRNFQDACSPGAGENDIYQIPRGYPSRKTIGQADA
jgi:hypothetical protein